MSPLRLFALFSLGGCGWLGDAWNRPGMDGGVDGDLDQVEADMEGGDVDGDGESDMDNPFCVNPPNTFSITSPTSEDLVSVTPEFAWQANGDEDSEDAVSYQVQIFKEDGSVYYDTDTDYSFGRRLTENHFQLPAEHALQVGQRYRVVITAYDLCGLDTAATIYIRTTSGADGDADVDGDVDSDSDIDTDTEVYCNNAPSAGTFTLISPANGSEGQSLSPEFVFGRAIDGDPDDIVNYTIRIGIDGDADGELAEDEILYTYSVSDSSPGPIRFTMPDDLAGDTVYHYQIVAEDLCSQETASPVYSFRTVADCPPAPEAFDFTGGPLVRHDVPLFPRIEWESHAEEGVTYRAECSLAPTISPDDPGYLLVDSLAVNYFTPALLENSTYYCRVTAVNTCLDETEVSEVLELHTIEVCDFPAIDPPVLGGPNGEMQPLEPIFSWDAVVGLPAGDSARYHLVVMRGDTMAFDAYTTETSFDMRGEFVLAEDTPYTWYIEVVNSCGVVGDASEEVAFRTMAGACLAAPGAFEQLEPVSGAMNVSRTPTFIWGAAADTAGDRVTYTLTVFNSAGLPVVIERGIRPLMEGDPTISFTLLVSLDPNSIFTWSVDAADSCDPANVTHGIGGGRIFTTERECLEQPAIVVNFTDGTGTQIDITTVPAALRLDRDWEYRWDAASGLLPSESEPAWTRDPLTGGTTEIVVDPVTGEPAMYIDSTAAGFASALRCVRNRLGFSNARGSAFEIRGRVEQALGTDGFGCAIEMSDDARGLRFGMDELRILETYTSEDFPVDASGSSHTYYLGLRGAGFSVFSDGVFAFDEGEGTLSYDNLNWLRWGDQSAAPAIQCEMYANHFYYDTRGNVVPFFDTGNWEHPFDLSGEPGRVRVNSGEVALVEHILLQTRTSADGSSWPATWDELGADGSVTGTLRRYMQLSIELDTDDTTETPEIAGPIRIEYCVLR